MKCFNHAVVDAIGVCKHCNKGLCRECAVQVTDTVLMHTNTIRAAGDAFREEMADETN